MDPSGPTLFIYVGTVDPYNQVMGGTGTLDENEVLLSSNLLDTEDISQLEINGIAYDTKQAPSDVIPANYGIEIIYLGFSSEEKSEEVRSSHVTFNAASNKEEIGDFLSEMAEEKGVAVQSQEQVSNHR